MFFLLEDIVTSQSLDLDIGNAVDHHRIYQKNCAYENESDYDIH